MPTYEPGALWRPYGLQGDPFFTQHLSSAENVNHGIHLFRGDGRRQLADRIIQRTLNSDSSVRLIEGANGIGKATLANLAKHILKTTQGTAVYEDIIHVELRHERPMEAFAAAILHAAINALEGADPQAAQEARDAGKQLILDDLIDARGTEIGLTNILSLKRSRTQLLREARERPFAEWHGALQSVSASARASGIDRIVIHINNIDQAVLEDAKSTGDLFGSTRDLFQMQGYHFILCASESFRTRSLKDRKNFLDILGTPLRPEPLQRDDVVQIMQARYQDLQIPDEPLTPPMDPDHFADLYEVFAGELRATLEAAGQIFKEELGPTGTPRVLEAQDILTYQTPIIEDLLRDLTSFQYTLLRCINALAGPENEVRQSDVVRKLQDEMETLAQGTVSGAAEVLAANHWIQIERRHARATYYHLGGRARIISDHLEA